MFDDESPTPPWVTAYYDSIHHAAANRFDDDNMLENNDWNWDMAQTHTNLRNIEQDLQTGHESEAGSEIGQDLANIGRSSDGNGEHNDHNVDMVLNTMTLGTAGPSVGQIIDRQPIGAHPWVHSGDGATKFGELCPRPTDASAAMTLRRSPGPDTHRWPEPILSRTQDASDLNDTVSSTTGIDNQSEAVFSHSSNLQSVTAPTSEARSRRRTYSTRSDRPATQRPQARRRVNGSDSSRPAAPPQDIGTLECHCGKRFDIPSALKKHQKYHVEPGNRQHVCPSCSMDFALLKDLGRHIFKMHQDQRAEKSRKSWDPATCDACGKRYSRKDGLLRHISGKAQAQTCAVHYHRLSEAAPSILRTQPSNTTSAARIDMADQVMTIEIPGSQQHN